MYEQEKTIDIPSNLKDWYSDPEKVILLNELTREIRQECNKITMQKLPESQRIVFILRNTLDLTYHEISEILGVSESVIKARLNRARSNLLKHFQSKCQWYLEGDPSPCCQSKIGFALAQDTEVLKRIYDRMEELKLQENTDDINWSCKSVDEIYSKLPIPEINTELAKDFLKMLSNNVKT